jgi:LCP family protein required for cell wall assembly
MGEKKLKKIKNKIQKTGKKKALKITLITLGVIALFVAGIAIYGFTQLGKVNTVSLDKTPGALGISEAAKEKDENIINIAFFGLDRRDPKEPSRSDSIMILSVDKKHKKIKMNSIMRDTYVKVKDHGETKITHAYAYGQAQLAVRTLNENFEMNIKDFVAVDFYKLENIIDTLGGVEINVKAEEINQINKYMKKIAKIENKEVIDITKSGKQTLNGMQAVSYSRIRHTAGGDFERTERQRTVLTALFNKIQSGGVAQLSSNVSKLLPFVETSMNSMDIVTLGTSALATGTTKLEQERFPLDGYCKGAIIDKVWYLKADLNATTNQLHKYIYEDVKPVPGEPLF